MATLENAHALIVGIANYAFVKKLPATVRKDAQDIHDLLVDPFHCAYPPANVRLLLDEAATKSALLQALGQLAADTTADSTAFIYFSGHGGRIPNDQQQEAYLLPVHARYTTPAALIESAIAGSEFTTALHDIPARKVVVIFDCCHAGGIGQPKEAIDHAFKSGLPAVYYEQLQRGKGRVIFSASRSDESSWVLPGDQNSVFTKHLLAGLKGELQSAEGFIRIFDLFHYLQPRVTNDRADQHPVFKAEIEDNFPIALCRRKQPVAVDLSHFRVAVPFTEPRYFFGRERDLRRLFSLWQRPPLQNAAIIGPKRSGKSWLLHYLATITTTAPAQLRSGQRHDWLPQQEQVRWVYVDFQDPRLSTQEGLLHHLLTGLDLRIPRRCDLPSFMDAVGQGLHNPAIILLDELGVALTRYPELDDMFWEGLRSLATTYTNGKLGFVLAAHESPVTLAKQSSHSSPFFNIFGYTTVLGPLTEAEARTLIAASSLPFAEADVTWILEQSRRWPILLQALCRERLAALADGETNEQWKTDGLRQIEQYAALLQA